MDNESHLNSEEQTSVNIFQLIRSQYLWFYAGKLKRWSMHWMIRKIWVRKLIRRADFLWRCWLPGNCQIRVRTTSSKDLEKLMVEAIFVTETRTNKLLSSSLLLKVINNKFRQSLVFQHSSRGRTHIRRCWLTRTNLPFYGGIKQPLQHLS